MDCRCGLSGKVPAFKYKFLSSNSSPNKRKQRPKMMKIIMTIIIMGLEYKECTIWGIKESGEKGEGPGE
jgi:hypothetical protein